MSPSGIRILCLGNELLADDGAGLAVAALLRSRELGDGVQIAESAAGGLRSLDDIVGVQTLIVVDAVLTGKAPPGTVRVLAGEELMAEQGAHPHALSLGAAVALARRLGLDAPSRILAVAIEAADTTTLGAPICPAVQAGVEEAARRCEELVRNSQLLSNRCR